MELLVENIEYAEFWISGNTYPVKEKIKEIAKSVGGIAKWEDNVWKIRVPFQGIDGVTNQILAFPGVNLARSPQSIGFRRAQSATPAQAPVQQQVPQRQVVQRQNLPLLKVLEVRDTDWGRKIVVTHSLDAMKNSQLREKLQQVGLWRKQIGYLGSEGGVAQYGISNKPVYAKQVRDVMSEFLDVSQLDKYLSQQPEQTFQLQRPAANQPTPPAPPKTRTFLFEDKGTVEIEDPNLPPDERGQHRRILQRLKIMYQSGELLNDAEKKLRIELISYNFEQVQREKEVMGRSGGREKYRIAYYVAGTYDQYVVFGKLLKRYGFDTKQYRAIFDAKFKDRNGQYPQKIEADPSEEFINNIPQQLPNNQLPLYDAQKRGIGFLYGRRRGILGDETGTGKCIVSAYVQTTCGNLKIEDIWKNFAKRVIDVDGENEQWGYPDKDIFVHSVDQNGKIVKGKIVGFYRQKINCKIKEVVSWTNKKIETTLSHKFLTPDGWKADIKKGDYICSSANQFSLNNNGFNNLEFAELLAWQIAEGHENDKRATIKITQDDLGILNRLKNVYESFLCSKGYIRQPLSRSSYLEISSRKYKVYLESLGYEWGHKSDTKKIPEFIMQANNNVVKVFLRAFFDAEGHVHKRERNIELSSASKELIYQISLLLQRFNIMCSFDKKMGCATNGKKIKRNYYRIKIIGSGVKKYMDQIGFGNPMKTKNYDDIKAKINSNRDGKPIYIILKPFFEKYKIPYRLLNIPKAGYVKGDTFATNDIIKNIIEGFFKLKDGNIFESYLNLKKSKWTNTTLATLEKVQKEDIDAVIDGLITMLENDLQYEKVKSVKYLNYDGYVYDLCIEQYENYIANNLICHNTAQLIGAAELKMKESNYDGDTLIITVNDDMVGQWQEEIIKVAGKDAVNMISTDPLNPKRWTILHYHMFSPASAKAKENTLSYVESLKNHNFKIVIFDELHKVKHKDAAKSKHLFDVIRSIPIKWGASATISSNKPMDVKNQLRMIGHTLGYIDDRKFKADFAAVGKKGRRKSPLEKFKDQVRAAENLNKWLHLTGVYVRRKKSDIRQDMPNIHIGESSGNINIDEFQAGLERRIQRLKKVMPLTVLGQARLQLAISKVPLTIDKVAQLVAEGKRVVVFTSFILSGMLLVEGYGSVKGLRETIKEIGAQQGHPEWDMLTYTSGTPLKDRMVVKPRFNKEPSNENPYRVLVMSIKMGGTGVDFPNAATNMVINDYDWTPESSEQSEGRIYRINTNRPVNIEYVLAEGTLDTLLYEKLQRKRELAAIIQQWRQDYQDELEPSKANAALEQIVRAQTEIKQIDQEVESEAMRLKKHGGSYKEDLTFRGYLDYFGEEEVPSVFDEMIEVE